MVQIKTDLNVSQLKVIYIYIYICNSSLMFESPGVGNFQEHTHSVSPREFLKIVSWFRISFALRFNGKQNFFKKLPSTLHALKKTYLTFLKVFSESTYTHAHVDQTVSVSGIFFLKIKAKMKFKRKKYFHSTSHALYTNKFKWFGWFCPVSIYIYL